jgi:hypothetical protein
MKKRGISTIISAFLLILLVLIMAGIIIFWSRGITGEAITIKGENIALVCYNIFFQSSYDNGMLHIINDGNVEIHSVKLITHNGVDSEAQDIKELSSNWPQKGLSQGEVFSDSINFDPSIKELSIIPILISDEESRREAEHICEHKEMIIKIS